MAKKKKAPAKKAAKPRKKPEAKPQGEVLPPKGGIEDCIPRETAKFIEIALKDAAAPAALDFSILQGDVAHLMGIPAHKIRSTLVKHLELAALTSIKLANDTLNTVASPQTSEIAKEVYIRRLGSFAHFTESVNRTRINIQKAGFMKDDNGEQEEEKDPADLTDAEWTAKYQPQLVASTKPDVQ